MKDTEAVVPNTIRVISQSFTGPLKAEVETFNMVYPQGIGRPKKMSAEEIEVKLAAFLQHAAFSGFNVTVRNESDPRLGMGGYRPCIEVRPDYPTVRAKMTEIAEMQAHFEKHGCHGFIPAGPEEPTDDVEEQADAQPGESGDWLKHKP
jgi:hypothetical protein